MFPDSKIRYNDRTAIHPLELDVFVVDKQIAFEYDGKAFHQEHNDLRKNLICANAKIKLFRIKEAHKAKPLPHIIDQLEAFGFSVADLDQNQIITNCTRTISTAEELKTLVAQYKTYADFKAKEPLAYRLIKANQNLWCLTDGLQAKHRQHSFEKLEQFLASCSTKSDVLKYAAFYQAIRKEPTLWAKYKLLPRANARIKRLDDTAASLENLGHRDTATTL